MLWWHVVMVVGLVVVLPPLLIVAIPTFVIELRRAMRRPKGKADATDSRLRAWGNRVDRTGRRRRKQN